jgi:hypothetical protein
MPNICNFERDTGFEPATFSLGTSRRPPDPRREPCQHGKLSVSRRLKVPRADRWRWEYRWDPGRPSKATSKGLQSITGRPLVPHLRIVARIARPMANTTTDPRDVRAVVRETTTDLEVAARPFETVRWSCSNVMPACSSVCASGSPRNWPVRPSRVVRACCGCRRGRYACCAIKRRDAKQVGCFEGTLRTPHQPVDAHGHGWPTL